MKELKNHQTEQYKKITNRLKRAHGQLGAAINALESNASCEDIVYQLSAVSKAVDRAGFLVISSALKECINNPDDSSEYDTDKLEKLFLTLS